MKKKKPYGKNLKERLNASIRDRLYHFTLADNSVRGVVLNGTRMVNEMRANHELGILETLVLGHAYIAAALMSANLKGNDRLKLQVDCSGPIKGLVAEANAFGEVRGYLKQVPIAVEEPVESFNLSPFFGAGFLSVSKYIEGARQPFTGKIMLEHGSLAKDLALYHEKSEQIQTSLYLSVSFDQQGLVEGAGGLFLQAMPGAEETVLERIETIVGNMPSLGKCVQQDDFPDVWLQNQFSLFTPKRIGHRGIEFMCHCNRKQIKAMLMMLNPEEIRDMADNGPFPVQIRCHHCNTVYDFSQKQMRMLSEARLAGNSYG